MGLRFGLWWAVTTSLGVATVAGSGCARSSNETAPDGGASDVGIEAAADAAPDADAGGCQPLNVSGFRPPPFAVAQPSAACNGFNADGGLVQGYGDACLGHAATYD